MAVNQSGGAYLPSGNYDRTGATDSNGTYASSTITSPSITGTTSIGSGATITSPAITGGTLATTAFTGYTDFVEAGSTANPLTNYGLSTIVGASSGVSTVYPLAGPVSGSIKRIAVITASSTVGATTAIQASTGPVTFDGTNTKCTFTVGTLASLVLNGISTTRWVILGSTANLTFST